MRPEDALLEAAALIRKVGWTPGRWDLGRGGRHCAVTAIHAVVRAHGWDEALDVAARDALRLRVGGRRGWTFSLIEWNDHSDEATVLRALEGVGEFAR